MSSTMPTDWQFSITDEEGKVYQYQLVTDPPAALYWQPSSYKLRLSDIKIASKCTGEDRKRLRRLILNDILETENEEDRDRSKRIDSNFWPSKVRGC